MGERVTPFPSDKIAERFLEEFRPQRERHLSTVAPVRVLAGDSFVMTVSFFHRRIKLQVLFTVS